ncbi:MAG TPA: hypothetical protein VFR81_15180 [Longimicrobium sp.]|nr:hypothetical protein [Longimicrobium sp.]
MTRGGRLLRALLLPAALAAAPGAEARAQDNRAVANVTASVTVVAPPIQFINSRTLEFGPVGPGQTVSVPAREPWPSAATWSGAFRFFNLRKQVDYAVSFTLPAALQRGAASIPVSFAGTQYGWACIWSTSAATCNAYGAAFSPAAHASPATAIVIDLPNSSPGNNFIGDFFVGGVITVPGAPLPPGTYTAPITITLAPVN